MKEILDLASLVKALGPSVNDTITEQAAQIAALQHSDQVLQQQINAMRPLLYIDIALGVMVLALSVLVVVMAIRLDRLEKRMKS